MRLPRPILARGVARAVAFTSLFAATAAVPTRAGGFDAAADAVKLFVTLCVANDADAGRIGDLAATMGLRPLPAGDAALAPTAPGRTVRAWHLAGAGGEPLVLGIASGAEGGKAFSACSLSAPDVVARTAEDVLVARLALGRPFRVEPDARERVTYWHPPGARYGTVVSATDRTPAGQGGADFALVIAR